MDVEGVHKCDDSCICPYHMQMMYHWPKGKEHACQNRECEYARGYERRIMIEFARYYGIGTGV